MGSEQFEIIDVLFDGTERLITDDFYSALDVTKAVAMTSFLEPDVERRVARYKDDPEAWICEVSRGEKPSVEIVAHGGMPRNRPVIKTT